MLQDRKCKDCGCTFTGGPRAYYCTSCRYERQKKVQRESKARARKGQTRKLGSIDKCEMCGNPYVINAALQRFCPICQPIHAKEYDRKTSLEYYHKHKLRINPIRNMRRRIKFKYCVYCGKKFDVYGKRQTCSEECRIKNNRRWQRERYHKLKSK